MAKWFSEDALQIAEKRREVKGKGEKEMYARLNAEFQRIARSFPGGSNGKESDCNAGDLGLIPGFGRSPGEGNGYPLQYTCLENSTDRGAWRATAHGFEELDTSAGLTHNPAFVSVLLLYYFPPLL